jgi:hypothetical protein
MSQKSMELIKNEQNMVYGSGGRENVRFKQETNNFCF